MPVWVPVVEDRDWAPVEAGPVHEREGHHVVMWLALALERRGHEVLWGMDHHQDDAEVTFWSEGGPPRTLFPEGGVVFAFPFDMARQGILGLYKQTPAEWYYFPTHERHAEVLRDRGAWAEVFRPAYEPRGHYRYRAGDRPIPIGFLGKRSCGSDIYDTRNRCLDRLAEAFPEAVFVDTGDNGPRIPTGRVNRFRNACEVYALCAYHGEEGYSEHLLQALASGCKVLHNRTPIVEAVWGDCPDVYLYEDEGEIVERAREALEAEARPTTATADMLAEHTYGERARRVEAAFEAFVA